MRTTADTQQVVVFALESNEFGIGIAQVREIDRLVPITRVPRVPAHVEGIINLRGQLVPVVDLRTRLGMPHATPTKSARIIVAEIGSRSIGMIVDEVREVVRIPLDQIAASEGVLEGLANEFVGALGRLGERLIILLDIEKVLGAEAPTVGTDKVDA
jgi:purine-binding chemotaxis protein CheW